MEFNFSTDTFNGKKLIAILLMTALLLSSLVLSVSATAQALLPADITTSTDGDSSGDASGDPAALPRITTKNYTVYIENIADLDRIRLAPGTYNTASDIKKAEGLVTFSPALIESLTVDGVFTYDLPDGGDYSIWFKYNDQNELIMHFTADNFNASYEVYGTSITFRNLYQTAELIIARGTRLTYQAVKNNIVFRALSGRFEGKHSYTYAPLPDSGAYTVYMRSTTGKETISFFNCKAVYPSFELDGITLKVGSLDGVRVIRVAPGEWSTTKQVKNAEGNRNFTSSMINKKLTEDGRYVIVFPGTCYDTPYTVSVEYIDGHATVDTFRIMRKAPTVDVADGSVTFGSLDGLYIIRYAAGTYSSATEIKTAIKNKYILPASITDDTVTIDGLEGRYTFLVQYEDGSVNIITLDI